jgi:NADH dehydrogenase FAD-containing subunit
VSNFDELEFGVWAEERVVKTDKGNEFPCQIVLRATGVTLNSDLYSSTLPVDDQGRLKVDNHFRVEGHENVYAIGDICGTTDPNLAYVAREQANLLYANLAASVAGTETKAWEQGECEL